QLHLVTGRNYAAGEYGRQDKFSRAFGNHSWYVGKHYSGETEVISMGLERLYSDPAGFALQDPEYFRFVAGVANGKLL
ncbi:hypothetical protein ACI3PL_31645, partial [Lacticaseibacillus paracasei]